MYFLLKFTDDGQTWTVTRIPKNRIGMAVFFTFWLLMWGGCGGVAAFILFSPMQLIYWVLVVLWATGTGLGVSMWIWSVVGDATLTMSPQRIQSSLRFLPFRPAKKIDIADVTQIDLYVPTHGNGQLKKFPALRIETADDAITFGLGASSDQLIKAITALREQLSRRGGVRLPPTHRLNSIPAHRLQMYDATPGSQIASAPMTATARRCQRGFEMLYAIVSVGWFTMLGVVGVAALIRGSSDGNAYDIAFGVFLVLLSLICAGVPTGFAAYHLLRCALENRRSRES